eukprot:gene23323-30564_t
MHLFLAPSPALYPPTGLKIMLVASLRADVQAVQEAKELDRQASFDHELKRAALRRASTPGSTGPPNGEFTFQSYKTLQSPALRPSAAEAMKLLHKCAADEGIQANGTQNQKDIPQVLAGFRKYDRIRETLIHELAHMEIDDHNNEFKALKSQLTLEVHEALSRRGGGRYLVLGPLDDFPAYQSELDALLVDIAAAQDVMKASAKDSGKSLKQLAAMDEGEAKDKTNGEAKDKDGAKDEGKDGQTSLSHAAIKSVSFEGNFLEAAAEAALRRLKRQKGGGGGTDSLSSSPGASQQLSSGSPGGFGASQQLRSGSPGGFGDDTQSPLRSDLDLVGEGSTGLLQGRDAFMAGPSELRDMASPLGVMKMAGLSGESDMAGPPDADMAGPSDDNMDLPEQTDVNVAGPSDDNMDLSQLPDANVAGPSDDDMDLSQLPDASVAGSSDDNMELSEQIDVNVATSSASHPSPLASPPQSAPASHPSPLASPPQSAPASHPTPPASLPQSAPASHPSPLASPPQSTPASHPSPLASPPQAAPARPDETNAPLTNNASGSDNGRGSGSGNISLGPLPQNLSESMGAAYDEVVSSKLGQAWKGLQSLVASAPQSGVALGAIQVLSNIVTNLQKFPSDPRFHQIVLSDIVTNMQKFPNDPRFHQIRLNNKAFHAKAGQFPGAVDVLLVAGFARELVPLAQPATGTEPVLKLKRKDPGLQWLVQSVIEAAQQLVVGSSSVSYAATAS